MIDWKSTAIQTADIHCHIIPFVDDGAEDYEDAENLIREEYSQGVRVIVLTAHYRNGAFDTPINKVAKKYKDLKKWISTTDMSDMVLLLSREYHCDERLEALLDGYSSGQEEIVFENKRYVPKEEIVPFGKHKCILLEFSSNKMQDSEFEIFIKKASQAGLIPIVAHVERYPAVQDRPTIVYRMKKHGALVQVNCESLLSKAKTKECEIAQGLVRHKMVDLISSDCHDLENRPPKMKKCYLFLKKKYGVSTADELMRNKAISLIYGEEVGNCKELVLNVRNKA
ncbi:tyrosine-protein phosphatase [Butyrivibrio sp. VCB2006]|uniref:tyrosine-protein phosphatase n=1 Tax=Butyrivibrio sp. VCB2006 TaxID=1280679 RepID=UPI00040D103D|nr:CpsB/CapC family capsule biosynthesis tyrosine phosphatase [Butyrivibrio sp. VCB2006]